MPITGAELKRMKQKPLPVVFIRLPTVKAKTGLSRSTIYARVAVGSFPKPVNLGSRAMAWIESEVDQWMSDQITRSRSVPRWYT